jgi:IS5 family transposase
LRLIQASVRSTIQRLAMTTKPSACFARRTISTRQHPVYGLSDDQAEFQIQDRLSFMRFLGLGLGDRVPDAKTIWLFREQLTQARAVETLFARFDEHLGKAGYLAMGGQIVDATIVAAPKQRNTDAEKASIKAGKVPEHWQDNPARLRQKGEPLLRHWSERQWRTTRAGR